MLRMATLILTAAALPGWILGCGGTSPAIAQVQAAQAAAPLDPATSGTLSVHLVQDGLPGPLSHLNLALTALEVQMAGSWVTVPLAPAPSVDVLAGTGQAPLLLADDAPCPAGVVESLRFTFGSGSTVQLAADDPETTHTLAMPTRLVGAVGLPGSFSVTARQATDLWISFAVNGVAQPDSTDDGGYTFVPGAVRGYDRAATGSISGTLANPAGPIQGAPITAQLQATDGQPGAAIAFRTVASDAEGHFTLDLLPRGYTWCAVGQPVLDSVAYYAQASPGFALGDAPDDQVQTALTFSPATSAGSVSGTVASAPGPGQEDVVDLIQEIPVGGTPFRFVVASAAVAAQDGQLRFSFPSVPPGIYSAVLNLYTQTPDQGREDQAEPSAPFTVSAGINIPITF